MLANCHWSERNGQVKCEGVKLKKIKQVHRHTSCLHSPDFSIYQNVNQHAMHLSHVLLNSTSFGWQVGNLTMLPRRFRSMRLSDVLAHVLHSRFHDTTFALKC